MDIHFSLDGTDFVWDDTKAASNLMKHDGISFEQAATVFLDPLFRLADAERNDEAIRIISARKATNSERYDHEHF